MTVFQISILRKRLHLLSWFFYTFIDSFVANILVCTDRNRLKLQSYDKIEIAQLNFQTHDNPLDFICRIAFQKTSALINKLVLLYFYEEFSCHKNCSILKLHVKAEITTHCNPPNFASSIDF